MIHPARPSILLRSPDGEAFAPYGSFIGPADKPGQRKFFSEHLQARKPGSDPIFHVNHILPSSLPLEVAQLERHPFAAQCFIPLDLARYVVAVMPSDSAGNPLPDRTLAFLMPPNLGVIYHPGVWHLGATVLDRIGHFAVLMWRGGAGEDDEFRSVPPLSLTLPQRAMIHAANGAQDPSERSA